ncbi:MAG: MMPL family transporter, partial [Mycobacteriaceae bacterium]
MSLFSHRRLRWILPALLIVVWLGIGSFGGPFAGKLGEVQSNDSASFLPASAEATQVAKLQKQFSSTDNIPAVIIAERSAGITQADREFLTQVTGSLEGKRGFGGAASPVIPSKDGRALEVIVPVNGAVDPGVTVKNLRDDLASATPEGLSVLVGGPGGQIADLTAAFGGIDGILLLVAGLVVIVILVVVYRSPILPLLVVLSAVFALGLASLVIYLLADNNVLALNGQSQGILFILVFGAATDYALLLVSRFREQLRDTPDKFDALWQAWRATVEPIVASGGTVILGVLCLLFSDLNSNRGLGPVAAIGIGCSLLASLTFLPAALALVGRAAFWPVRPKAGSEHQQGLWWGLSRRIGARPRVFWAGSLLVLLIAAAFLPTLKAGGVAQSDLFLTKVDSVAAQKVIGAHFPGGSGSPAIIVTAADRADAVAVAAKVDGVSQVVPQSSTGQLGGPPKVVDGKVLLDATLTDAADSETAVATLKGLREAVHAVAGADALVGGPTATQLDTQTTSERDRRVIIPIVLVVVFGVLALLLRALVAPLLLIATVVLSFAATLGVSALVFNHLFHFPGADPTVPLFGFVFL